MADNPTPPPSKTQIPNPKNDGKKLILIQKVAALAAFLVLLPLIPSQPPDFINQSLFSRSWELLQLIFVGIAVSYGLFSKKNDAVDENGNNDNPKDHQSSNFDNAQSYVSKLLQVSSVFYDESSESPTLIDENNKVQQTWSSQYYREKPVTVVAEENPSLKEENTVRTSRFSHKPLLLPVRSLKHRVSEPEEEELGGSLSSQETEEDSAVLRSPVPWRSRSGRMEMKESGDGPPPSVEGRELDPPPPKSCLSPSASVSFPRRFSPSTSFPSSEAQSKLGQDLKTKKKVVASSPPPPPPPPPLVRKPTVTKPSASAPKREFTRSVKSVPQESLFEIKADAGDSPKRRSSGSEIRAKSVRTFRTSGSSSFSSFSSSEAKKYSIDEDASKDGAVEEEKVLIETSDDDSGTERDDDDGGDRNGCSGGVSQCKEAKNDDDDGVGPDVDKKADEFIAKFREQIRLQRIESIRRSATQRAGKARIK